MNGGAVANARHLRKTPSRRRSGAEGIIDGPRSGKAEPRVARECAFLSELH
jgi:hypothetical protein